MMYYIKDDNGHRWKVKEAISLKAACNEVVHARATGSIGSSSYVDETRIGGNKYCKASVVRIHSDFTEQKPYERLR